MKRSFQCLRDQFGVDLKVIVEGFVKGRNAQAIL